MYKMWRLQKKGEPNLACVLNGHTLCQQACSPECSTNTGHCICGTIVVYSDDRSLVGLGGFYADLAEKLGASAYE